MSSLQAEWRHVWLLLPRRSNGEHSAMTRSHIRRAAIFTRGGAPDLPYRCIESSSSAACGDIEIPVCFHRNSSDIHLPASLCSTGITRLHRYYERSDSCPAGRPRTGLSASCVLPSDHSASNHLVDPAVALTRYPSARRASLLNSCEFTAVRASPLASRLADTTRPNRVHLRCGLAVRLTVFPTPPRGDAVPFGYKPENVYLKRTSTFLTGHTCRHTGNGCAKACRTCIAEPRSVSSRMSAIWKRWPRSKLRRR
jgi:hypothetical protein